MTDRDIRGFGIITLILGLVCALLASFVVVLLLRTWANRSVIDQLACQVQQLGGAPVAGADCPPSRSTPTTPVPRVTTGGTSRPHVPAGSPARTAAPRPAGVRSAVPARTAAPRPSQRPAPPPMASVCVGPACLTVTPPGGR